MTYALVTKLLSPTDHRPYRIQAKWGVLPARVYPYDHGARDAYTMHRRIASDIFGHVGFLTARLAGTEERFAHIPLEGSNAAR